MIQIISPSEDNDSTTRVEEGDYVDEQIPTEGNTSWEYCSVLGRSRNQAAQNFLGKRRVHRVRYI